ncbi:MAG: hypothetical protein E3K32_12040 [wastewater metagenome]|nr:hypothetical protein [Candidatus Loosdrechtia aerotolerans]
MGEKWTGIYDKKNDFTTLVISPNDYRFVSFIHIFLTENLKIQDNYDHIAISGSLIKSILPGIPKVTLNEIDISLNLHRVRRLIIIELKDYNTYSRQSKSEKKEGERSSYDLKRIRNILKRKHSDLEIDLFLASCKEVGNEKFYYMERIR